MRTRAEFSIGTTHSPSAFGFNGSSSSSPGSDGFGAMIGPSGNSPRLMVLERRPFWRTFISRRGYLKKLLATLPDFWYTSIVGNRYCHVTSPSCSNIERVRLRLCISPGGVAASGPSIVPRP